MPEQTHTWTWEEISKAIDKNTEDIITEIQNLKRPIPSLPKNHIGQKQAKMKRIAAIAQGSETTKFEIKKILDGMKVEDGKLED